MSSRTAQTAFTLIELLVALSIVAIVMGLCASGFRFGVKVWDRVGEHSVQLEDAYVTRRVLQSIASQAVGPHQDDDESDDARLHFIGEPERVRFVATAPVLGSDDYLYNYDLHYDHKSRILQLSYSPFSHLNRSRSTYLAVLEKNVVRVRFRYFGPDLQTGELKWNTHWRGPTIPLLIAMSVTGKKGAQQWPETVIETRNGPYIVR